MESHPEEHPEEHLEDHPVDHLEDHPEEHPLEHLEDHEPDINHLVIADRLNDLYIEVALAAIQFVQNMLGSADTTSFAIVSILEGVIDLDFEVIIIGLGDHIDSVDLLEHFD